jgi:transcriptional regulator with XRE-family HTH domain
MRPSDYQDIGQYLRESRESLRISLQEAAQALHIRGKYLEALESGDLMGLPGKSYTRGYIRNYAQYLQLDVDEVLEAYAELLGPRTSELFIPEQTLRKNLPTRWLIWLSLAGFALLYGCWYFAFHDRTEIERIVADLPAGFAHLLDKHAPVAMDKAWKDCLSDGNAACWLALRARAVMPQPLSLYDIKPEYIPPREP